MFRIIDNNIYLTKGDTAQINVSLQERPLFVGDQITLTLRESLNDATPALTITSQTDVIDILPSDTSSLTSGIYYYDIQLNSFNEKVFTISSGWFELREGVTQ